jgi:predicted lipid-binding transport protein (Tim44 family)
MREVVNQIAAATGLAPDVAEKAIGMMLGFLEEEADDDAVQKMIAAVPGARQLISEYGSKNSGGFLTSLVGGGLMGLGQQLMGLGMGMGEITTLAKQTIAIAKQHAGEEVVDKVVASVPGLGQFV